MISTQALPQLVRELGDACGFALELMEESVIIEGEHLAATARSPKRSEASRPVSLEALAKISVAPNEAGGTETWALVWFVNASAWRLLAGAT